MSHQAWRAGSRVGVMGALALALAACGGGGGGSSDSANSGGSSNSNSNSSGGNSDVVFVSRQDAQRFLEQASFGAAPAALADLQAGTANQWIARQFTIPATGYNGFFYVNPSNQGSCTSDANTIAQSTDALMLKNCSRDYYGLTQVQRMFFANAINGQDQLRQRVAFALSQLFVTSGYEAYAQADYQNMLLNDAFGNFRDLMRDVTLHPVMGSWLNMVNNGKPNPVKGVQANENYARELMQLFTIGLEKLNADGSVQTDSNGDAIPTYGQAEITAMARAMTGWTFPPLPGALSKWTNPTNRAGKMVAFDNQHDVDAKVLLNGQTLPAGQTAQQDLDGALDIIFNHPNVGPFVGKQLIQKLVTSNPGPAYIARVSAAFNDNGSGVRGDMKAVIKAILLDPEARGSNVADAAYGHLREPALFMASLLRTLGATTDGMNPRNATAGMSQAVFASPSVFNFYSPQYRAPGAADLYGPEFGILDTSSALARMNAVGAVVLQSNGVAADSSVSNSVGTRIDFSAWTGITDPDQLVNQMAALLLHDDLPADAHATIVAQVKALSAKSVTANPQLPARTVAYLIATSPLYEVQR
ncbi:hypothetical protein JCM19000A_22680 [Silvimonas sp. JCM 19000]